MAVMAVQDEKETMDDGGNGNGTIPNEREESLLLIQKKELQQLLLIQLKELQHLQRSFKDKWCLTLTYHRLERRMPGGVLGQPVTNILFEDQETMQAWARPFQTMINLVGAEAMLVFLFKTMKNTHSIINGRMIVVDENDTDEELERITMFEIIRECNGTDEAMRMVEAFEVLVPCSTGLYSSRELPQSRVSNDLPISRGRIDSVLHHHYEQGTIQVDGIYYLLKHQQRMLHKYRTLFVAAVLGNTLNGGALKVVSKLSLQRCLSPNNNNDDDSFETRLATIFTFQTDDEDSKTSSSSDTTAATTTTLFQKACTGLGRKTGLELLEETIGRSSQSINTRRALVYAATTNNEHRSANNNKEIHLDYIFLLLRREPDVLLSSTQKSSSSLSSSSSSSASAVLMPPSLEGSSSSSSSSSSSNNISSNSTNTDNG